MEWSKLVSWANYPFYKSAGHYSLQETPLILVRSRDPLRTRRSSLLDGGHRQEALKSWVTFQTPGLRDGRHLLSVNEILGVPFEMVVRKASGRAPGIFFSRQVPEDNSLPDRVRKPLGRKVKKLAPYKVSGKTTVLLVESNDIALMNDSKMRDAIKTAYPVGLPLGVDQLWYADTSLALDIEFIDFTAELTR